MHSSIAAALLRTSVLMGSSDRTAHVIHIDIYIYNPNIL